LATLETGGNEFPLIQRKKIDSFGWVRLGYSLMRINLQFIIFQMDKNNNMLLFLPLEYCNAFDTAKTYANDKAYFSFS
jgi:hypothetical protein